jgi:hypothetical protein
MLLYEVSNTEEPCAEKPHAGICERAVGQLTVLSRCLKNGGKSAERDSPCDN